MGKVARRSLRCALLAVVIVILQLLPTATIVKDHGLKFTRASSIVSWYDPVRSHHKHPKTPKTHFLIPATDVNINLCKTLLATGILGYPSPSILAWKEPYDKAGGIGGGTHLLKISRVLQYLDSLEPKQDDDLVFMIDGYDIHFQLPFELLVSRYNSIIKSSNERLRDDMGALYHRQKDLRQSVVFGAGKRCAPNALWEVSCYTVPDSPVTDELYGNNTDTMLGHNQWFSCRQKYINSGYIIGPVGAMRKLFERAQQRAEEHKDRPIYGASDQAIFAIIMGEQNYVREQRRVAHLTELDSHSSTSTSQPRRITIQGGLLIDNVLDPSITHTDFIPDLAVNYEFGITLDYSSDLGHQTMNSDIGRDAQYIWYNDTRTHEEQVNAKFARHGSLDCQLNVPPAPPADVLNMKSPYSLLDQPNKLDRDESWFGVPLYTHLCFGTVPVMIHHNGGKQNREEKWTELWLQRHAKDLLMAQMQNKGPAFDVADWNDFKANPGVKLAGGAWTDRSEWIDWRDMCPDWTYGEELWR